MPGSKSTAHDLRWLAATGLADAVRAAAAGGRPVLGVCGGYQMLGEAVEDPEGVESPERVAPGLGLLPVRTTFAREKTTVRVRARVRPGAGLFAGAAGREVRAYEIHAGVTRGGGGAPFEILERSAPRPDPYERLADIVGAALDVPAIAKLVGLAFPKR